MEKEENMIFATIKIVVLFLILKEQFNFTLDFFQIFVLQTLFMIEQNTSESIFNTILKTAQVQVVKHKKDEG